jgi:GDPmannose 4,6-dehydratase
MFASTGIMFNTESPLRGENFVTKKITSQLAEIKRGERQFIELGNMDSKRDWSFAGDTAKGIYAIMQHNEPTEFVLATGETHSVREFFELSCGYFGLDPDNVLRINNDLIRPKDVDVLIGDASKARELLGWEPECDFQTLVLKMCEYDDGK